MRNFKAYKLKLPKMVAKSNSFRLVFGKTQWLLLFHVFELFIHPVNIQIYFVSFFLTLLIELLALLIKIYY